MMRHLLAPALLMTIFLPRALAAEPGALGVDESRWYLAARAGWVESDLRLGNPYNGIVDDEAISYGIAAGARVLEHLALEAAVEDFGSHDGRATPCPEGLLCALAIEPTDNDIYGFSLSSMPELPLDERLFVYGRLGYYWMEVDTDIAFEDGEFDRDGIMYGAGVRWRFAPALSVSIEALTRDGKMDQAALGLRWHP